MRPGARTGLGLAVGLEETARVLLLEEERECVEDVARILGAKAGPLAVETVEGCPRPIPAPTPGFGFSFGFEGLAFGLGLVEGGLDVGSGVRVRLGTCTWTWPCPCPCPCPCPRCSNLERIDCREGGGAESTPCESSAPRLAMAIYVL